VVVAVAAAAGMEIRSPKNPRVQVPARRVAVAAIRVFLAAASDMVIPLSWSFKVESAQNPFFNR
jgi:hypothetical protein